MTATVTPAELRLVEQRLDAIHEDVKEVRDLAAQTNGRVRSLELWKAKVDGAKWAVGWVPPLVTSAFVAVLTVALSAVFLH